MRSECLTRCCRASIQAASARFPMIPASSSCMVTSATRRRSMMRCAASARSATWRRWSGSASISATRPCTPAVTTSGPRFCSPRWPVREPDGSCWPHQWLSTARAPTRAPSTGLLRRRRRDTPLTSTRAGSSHAASAAARPCHRSWCPRMHRSGRATSTRRPRSRRNTSPVPGPGRQRVRRWRCAITTCTARGCRATRRTQGWRRSSALPWRLAARRGSSRTERSDGTSSTSAMSPTPPSPHLTR